MNAYIDVLVYSPSQQLHSKNHLAEKSVHSVKEIGTWLQADEDNLCFVWEH